MKQENQLPPDFTDDPWGMPPANAHTRQWREDSAEGRRILVVALKEEVSSVMINPLEWKHFNKLMETIEQERTGVDAVERMKLISWLGRAVGIGARTLPSPTATRTIDLICANVLKNFGAVAWIRMPTEKRPLWAQPLTDRIFEGVTFNSSRHDQWGRVPAGWVPGDEDCAIAQDQPANAQMDLINFLHSHHLESSQSGRPLVRLTGPISELITDSCVAIRILEGITNEVDPILLSQLKFFENLFDHAHMEDELLQLAGSVGDRKILTNLINTPAEGEDPHQMQLVRAGRSDMLNNQMNTIIAPWSEQATSKAFATWRQKSEEGRWCVNKDLGLGLPAGPEVGRQEKWLSINQMVDSIGDVEAAPDDRNDLLYWFGRMSALGAERRSFDQAELTDTISSILMTRWVEAARIYRKNELEHDTPARELVMEACSGRKTLDGPFGLWGKVPSGWTREWGGTGGGNAQTDLLTFLQGYSYQVTQQLVPFLMATRSIPTDSVAVACVALRIISNLRGDVDQRVLDHMKFFESLYDHTHIDNELLLEVGSTTDYKILTAVVERTKKDEDGPATETSPIGRRKM